MERLTSSRHGETQCAVCRAPTAKKCMPCARVGTDLYLCSAEHQKLVWPAHKLVCGKPGLSPPVLSQVELRELDQFADVRVLFDTTALGDIMFKRPREGSNEGRTVRQQCHDMWPMPLENLVFALNSGIMKQLAWMWSLGLTALRFSIYAAKNTRGRALPYASHSALTHAAVISGKVRWFVNRLGNTSDVPFEETMAPFEHQLLIFCQLVQLKAENKSPVEHSDTYIFRALETALILLYDALAFDSGDKAFCLAGLLTSHVHVVIRIAVRASMSSTKFVVDQCYLNTQPCSCCLDGCDHLS